MFSTLLSTLPPAPTSTLSTAWRRIQGSDNWSGLLRPLDPLLKQELIRYGDLANVCYRQFDQDPSSKRYLNCKSGKKRLLEGVAPPYEVTKYLYGCDGRWIGYVAVVREEEEVGRLGRRDVVVAFRGTVTREEWVANFRSFLEPARLDPLGREEDVKVESGFLGIYTQRDMNCRFCNESCREQALREVSRLIDKYKNSDQQLSITLTGHSMGSSLAILFGYDVAELGLNILPSQPDKIPITVYSFAGPRVGNSVFKRRCEELGVKVLRVVNVNDPVTKVPGVLLNESYKIVPWSCCGACYAHLGVELALEFSGIGDPVAAHDLDRYIEVLKGGDGDGEIVEDEGNGGGGGGGEGKGGREEDVMKVVNRFFSLQMGEFGRGRNFNHIWFRF